MNKLTFCPAFPGFGLPKRLDWELWHSPPRRNRPSPCPGGSPTPPVQAVSGATVNLEDPGWVGQETEREWYLPPRGAARDLPLAGPASARPTHFPKDGRAEALERIPPVTLS